MCSRLLLRALPATCLTTSRTALPSTTSTPSRHASTTPAAKPSVPSSEPPFKAPKPAKQRAPYFVARTASNQVPVYQRLGHGIGSSRAATVCVRKIAGDPHTLREELAAHLGTDNIEVRSVSNQVWIKGPYKDEVVRYLESKGF